MFNTASVMHTAACRVRVWARRHGGETPALPCPTAHLGAQAGQILWEAVLGSSGLEAPGRWNLVPGREPGQEPCHPHPLLLLPRAACETPGTQRRLFLFILVSLRFCLCELCSFQSAEGYTGLLPAPAYCGVTHRNHIFRKNLVTM